MFEEELAQTLRAPQKYLIRKSLGSSICEVFNRMCKWINLWQTFQVLFIRRRKWSELEEYRVGEVGGKNLINTSPSPSPFTTKCCEWQE